MFWTISLVLAALTFSQVPAAVLEPETPNGDVITGASSPGQRISGGWQTTPGQIPYLVYLDIIPRTGVLRNCGGSIVHREWVLTSASCLRNSLSVFVRAGFTNINVLPQYHHEAAEIVIHPSFNPDLATNNQRTDIGILKMRVPFVFTRMVEPIKIQPEANAADVNNVLLVASGWGGTTLAASAPVANQRFANLIGITNVACSTVYGTAFVFETHICTRGFTATAQSICPGDQGGPLARVGSDGEPLLVGIGVFWDTRGCERGNPAGFIRPGFFHGWLTDVTGLDFENL